MIRRTIAVIVSSLLGIAAVGCGAAPSTEQGESLAQGVVTHCSAPFTVLRVSTGGGQGDGVGPMCDLLTGPPALAPSPSGDVGDEPRPSTYAITSCAQATAVPPPSKLSACTAGYRLSWEHGYTEVFLCPVGTPLPATRKVGNSGSDSYGPFAHPQNGCFGDSLDPTYAFVMHISDDGTRNQPGNCGAKCGHF